MISGIDYSGSNDNTATITFINPNYIKKLERENKELCNSFKKIFNIINVDGYDCKNRNEFEKVLEKILKEISFVLDENKKYNLK